MFSLGTPAKVAIWDRVGPKATEMRVQDVLSGVEVIHPPYPSNVVAVSRAQRRQQKNAFVRPYFAHWGYIKKFMLPND